MGYPFPSGGGGGIPEAPTDGKQYTRQNSAWVEQSVTSVDTLTGAVSLSGNYAALSHNHVKADVTDFSDGDYVSSTIDLLHMTRGGTSQTISTGTATKVQFTTTVQDTQSAWRGSPNWDYVPSAGWYECKGHAQLGTTAGSQMNAGFYKNGVSIGFDSEYPDITTTGEISVGSIYVYLNGTDTLDLRVYQDSGSNQTLNGGTDRTWFQVRKVASS